VHRRIFRWVRRPLYDAQLAPIHNEKSIPSYDGVQLPQLANRIVTPGLQNTTDNKYSDAEYSTEYMKHCVVPTEPRLAPMALVDLQTSRSKTWEKPQAPPMQCHASKLVQGGRANFVKPHNWPVMTPVATHLGRGIRVLAPLGMHQERSVSVILLGAWQGNVTASAPSTSRRGAPCF
jgi:hypothetical protein